MLNAMRNRLTILFAVGLCAIGCDKKNEPIIVVKPATRAAVAPTSAPAAANQPLKDLPLAVIPFVANVPDSWAVGSGVGGRIVLHGTLASGDVEVLLSSRPSLNADDFKSFIAEQQRSTSQPQHVKSQLMTRDGMSIVETVDKPIEGLVTYNVKYLVAGPSLDYQVYELNIGDLTQEMYDKDGEFLRKILLGLRYDSKAVETPQ